MTEISLQEHLRFARSAVDAAIERALTRWEGEFSPVVLGAITHGVTGGGKRLRPILCMAAFRACGGSATMDQLADFAASLELIHGYSLMHDDLPCMDDAALRRGRPTTHRVHGVEITSSAGAALIPLAIHTAWSGALALGCTRSQALEAARLLCAGSGAGGMVGGQALDLLGENRSLREEELRAIHAKKTGALLTAALEMGGVAAGAPPVVRRSLNVYGSSIGLAFQIADDVLDATASAEELGKEPSDAELNKSTYVSIHGLEKARMLAESEVARAEEALESAGIPDPVLKALSRYIIERRH